MAVSCTSSKSGRDFLRIVFDGVPPESYYEARANASADEEPLAAGQAGDAVRVAEKPSLVVHPPFQKRKCGSCHDKEVGRVFPVITNLCFKCHDNFMAGVSYRHAPAGAGECLRWHAHHSSRSKSLLHKPQKELCAECHAFVQEPARVAHRPFMEGSCVVCHSPHGSSRAALLKDALDKLCLRCHEDFYAIKPSKAALDALAAKLGKAIEEGKTPEARQVMEQMGPVVLAAPVSGNLTALHLAAAGNRPEIA